MNLKQYAIYHGRWQLSTIVMMGPMFIATTMLGLPGWIALPIVQLIGACIFWYVDKWIFTE